MARPPVKSTRNVSSELMRAAQQRIAKLPWKKPTVRPVVKSTQKQGFSAQKMIRAAPDTVVNAADRGDVRIMRRQKRKNKGRLAIWFATSTNEKGQSRTHQQLVTVKDGAARLSDSEDMLYECDCGYWKFYCDWAAWKKGASELKHSINEPPDEKNSRYRVYPCKHLLRVCEHVVSARI